MPWPPAWRANCRRLHRKRSTGSNRASNACSYHETGARDLRSQSRAHGKSAERAGRWSRGRRSGMSQTRFLQDILHTAGAIQETLRGIGDGADDLAAQLLEHGARRFVAVGNGTSLYASLASVYVHNAFARPGGTL